MVIWGLQCELSGDLVLPAVMRQGNIERETAITATFLYIFGKSYQT
ncbi:hypothetical protein ANASTE_01034 [Anaerofustis stercorihominis DSM 17244]|uniref:Uncharacterized protein n=1 Tax=Anaerofustis stercorihominis DSM 17244 TaxID=445971 RepID=B1C8H7_9FIRM|nr:hypothetical protein ANASTE_01034 [Anaerofustis stercorihominis DSM 17244]